MKMIKSLFACLLITMFLGACGGGNTGPDLASQKGPTTLDKPPVVEAPPAAPPAAPPGDVTKAVAADLPSLSKGTTPVFTVTALAEAHIKYAQFINPNNPQVVVEQLRKNWDANFGASMDKPPQVSGIAGGLGNIASGLLFDQYLQFFRMSDPAIGFSLIGMDAMNESAHSSFQSGMDKLSEKDINSGTEQIQNMLEPTDLIRDRVATALSIYGVQVTPASKEDAAVKEDTGPFVSAVTDHVTKVFREQKKSAPDSMLGMLVNLATVFQDSIFVYKDKEGQNVYMSMFNFGEPNTKPPYIFYYQDHRLGFGALDPKSVIFWNE